MCVPVHRIAAISAVLLVLGFLGTACHGTNPVGPTVPLNQQFVIAPGQIAAIEGTAIRVQLVEVVNDSRCPIDATCLTNGDAVVAIQVFDDRSSSRYDLHTDDANRKRVTIRDVRLELLELQPYPRSSRRIDPTEYRATLRGSRE